MTLLWCVVLSNSSSICRMTDSQNLSWLLHAPPFAQMKHRYATYMVGQRSAEGKLLEPQQRCFAPRQLGRVRPAEAEFRL